ncbi:MAG: hypothetical protein J6R77_01445 [Clostridia bacterium]|nr:hypothetical protein [Clostridia bacterium]
MNEKIGATVPFTTYCAVGGKLVNGAKIGENAFIAHSSFGKSYVSLPEPGSAVVFYARESANRITVRYSAPYKSEAVLDVYVNEELVDSRTLNTIQFHGIRDGRLDDGVRAYYEYSVVAEVAVNDAIRLENKLGDISVNLIDLETAPAQRKMPEECLSIVDFGATPDDDTDDSDAIEACFKAAGEQGKHVFVPAGTFIQSRRIPIPAGVRFMGAGMWYSNIEFITPGTTFMDTSGYAMQCGNVISGIHFNDRASFSRGDASIMLHPFGNNQVLEDCWFSNVGCVFGWDYECCYTLMRRCRIIGTYFDGTHWGDGRYYKNEMYDNYFRGVGDDSIAQVNRADMGLCEDNYAHHNTIISSYWGRGISDVGGNNLTLTHNWIDSCYLAGIIITTEPLGPSKSRPLMGLLAEYNVINRCGHKPFDYVSSLASNLASIHGCLQCEIMGDVTVRHNRIMNAETHPIWVDDSPYNSGDKATEWIAANIIE